MSGGRTVPLGWRNSSPQAALAFLPPEPVSPADAAGLRHMVPGVSPGLDLCRRLFVLRAAFNVRIRLVVRDGKAAGFRQVPGPGAITTQAFNGLVSPIVPEAQRGSDTPACQISLNTIFVSDAPCSIQLMPARLLAQLSPMAGEHRLRPLSGDRLATPAELRAGVGRQGQGLGDCARRSAGLRDADL